MTTSPQRCGFITLAGAPNAGKSTLLNKMVGAKISIVSPKVQTTRTLIQGICMVGNAQIIFVDTPGIFAPSDQRMLEKSIVSSAWRGIEETDTLAILVDASRGICANTRLLLERVKSKHKRKIIILNKVDLVEKENLLALAAELHGMDNFERIFMISALTGDGVDDIKNYCASIVPEGLWMFAEDQLSTASERFLAAEITREALFHLLKDELPFSLSVDTEQWEEQKNGTKIHQVIYVLREGQKKIVLGTGGAMIKEIGQRSRVQLEELLGRRVHLFLFVKVKPDWVESPDIYRELGLDFTN